MLRRAGSVANLKFLSSRLATASGRTAYQSHAQALGALSPGGESVIHGHAGLSSVGWAGLEGPDELGQWAVVADNHQQLYEAVLAERFHRSAVHVVGEGLVVQDRLAHVVGGNQIG